MPHAHWGNQHQSRKERLMDFLDVSRAELRQGNIVMAMYMLETYRYNYAKAPASTRRRWRCGK